MNVDFTPKIDGRKCTGCALCMRRCPQHALAMANNKAVLSDSTACDYCGICEDICPTGAIDLFYEIVLG